MRTLLSAPGVLIVLSLLTITASAVVTPGKPDKPELSKEEALIAAYIKDAGVAPIRVPDKPVTREPHFAAYRAWVRRLFFEPMKRNLAGKPWQASAAGFAEQALDACFTPRWVDDEITRLIPAAEQLLKDGADDAVVLWMIAEVLEEGGDRLSASREVQAKAREAFRRSSYSKALGGILYISKARCLAKMEWHKEDEAKIKAAEYWIAALAEKDSLRPEDAPILIVALRGNLDYKVVRRHPDVFTKLYHPVQSQLPEWALETLAGVWQVEMAWKERGDDWANHVSPEAMEKSHEHLDAAERHFRKAWQLAPEQPYPCSRMIVPAMAGATPRRETPRVWFDRAVEARLDDWQTWRAMSLALSPQWGGSNQAIVALGLAAAQTERFDTFLPFQLMDALDKIWETSGDPAEWRALCQEPAVAAALWRVCTGYFNQAKSDAEREEFAWLQAWAGWLTGRYADGLAALKRTGQRPLPLRVKQRLSRTGCDHIQMRGELALGASGHGDAWSSVRHDLAARRPDKAIAAMQALPDTLPPDARELIRREIEIAGIEQRLEKGEWVKLTADASLSHWLWGAGAWKANAGGGLTLSGDDDQPILTHRARIGPDFEARGTFRVARPEKWWYSAGFAFGHFPGPDFIGGSLGQWFSCDIVQLQPRSYGAGIRYSFRDTENKMTPVPIPDPREIPWAVTVKDQKVTWSAAGKTLADGMTLPARPQGGVFRLRRDSCIGLSFLWAAAGNSVDIPPVEVRLLPP